MRLMKWLLAVSALALFAVAANADPTDDALDAVLARLQANDAAGALADLDGLAALTPAQQIRARYYRAYALNRTGERAKALDQLLGLIPPDGAAEERSQFVRTGGVYGEKAQALLAAIYNETQQYEKLVPLYDGMIQDYPDSPEWSFLRADALFTTGRFEEALTAYGVCVSQHPTYSRVKEAVFRKEETLRRLGRYQEAYDYLTALPTKDTEWKIRADVRRAELLSLHLKKDYDLSNRLCEDLITRYPEHPSIFLARWWLAMNYRNYLPVEQRDIERALTLLQGLVQDFPHEAMAIEWRVEVANILIKKKDYIKASALFQALLNETPDDYPEHNWHPYLRYRLGVCRRAQGNDMEAAALFRSVVEKYPQDCWAEQAKKAMAEGGSR